MGGKPRRAELNGKLREPRMARNGVEEKDKVQSFADITSVHIPFDTA